MYKRQDDDIDAGGPDERIDRTGPVGGRLVERLAVHPAPVPAAAAGDQPLAVQWRQSGQGREADPQIRVARPAEGAEGEPGGVQLLEVGDQGGPPGGRVPVGGRRRAGVDEQRCVLLGGRVQQRGAARPPGGVEQRGGGELEPHAAAGQLAPQRLGVRLGCGEADRGPDAEGGGQVQCAVVERGEQGGGLGGRQIFDAERAGERHQGQIEAVGAREPGAGRDVVVGGVDGVRGLARQVQRPAVQPRRRTARPQQRDELGRPDVLVDVGGHGPPSGRGAVVRTAHGQHADRGVRHLEPLHLTA